MATSWGDYCNGYSYTFTYVSGTPQTAVDSADLSTVFTKNSGVNSYSFTLSDLSWAGSHDLTMEGCLGDATGSPYYSTNCGSSTWTMVVTNPCETANFVHS